MKSTMPFTRTTWTFNGNIIFKGKKTMKMPKNITDLISDYSKPVTRGDWRTCKHKYIDELWEEIIDSKVFMYYIHKSQRYADYLPTTWSSGNDYSSDEE